MKLVLLGKTTLLGYTVGILLMVVWMRSPSNTEKKRMLQEIQEGLLYEQNTRSLNLLSSSMPQKTESPNQQMMQDHTLTESNLQPQTSTVKMCSQDQRKTHVNKMCSIMRTNLTWTKSRFVFDDKRKLLFCEISKSGCTTWKALWQHANNPNKTLEYYSKNPMMVHSFGHFWGKTNLTGRKPPVMDIANYTTFMAVRHPFERILSAFYNIKGFKKFEPGPDSHIREHISKTFNLTMKLSIPQLKLHQFVQYITDRRLSKRHYYDRHIVPYSMTCGICNISYDYILRLETNNDAKPMLNLLGYNEDVTHPFMINNKRQLDTDSQGNRHLKEFETLPRDLMERLLNRYQYDLKIFGYHYDIQTSKTWCSIEGDERETCC